MQCPAHPDLTNYVLKSTIPSKQDCPACICPKVKVNAGLCREPSKEECLKNTEVLKDAPCPKPEPCPEPVCPPQQPCPDPDPTVWIKRSELPPDWNKKCPPPKECSPCPRPPPPLNAQKQLVHPVLNQNRRRLPSTREMSTSTELP